MYIPALLLAIAAYLVAPGSAADGLPTRVVDVRCCNISRPVRVLSSNSEIRQCFNDTKTKFNHTGDLNFERYVFTNESAGKTLTMVYNAPKLYYGECIFKKLNLLDENGTIIPETAIEFVKKAWNITDKNILSVINTTCPNITEDQVGGLAGTTYAYNRGPFNFIICVYDSINLFCPEEKRIKGTYEKFCKEYRNTLVRYRSSYIKKEVVQHM